MERDSTEESVEPLTDETFFLSESLQSNSSVSSISKHEFSCHCCYDILVNPTTLTCGHNFCRHCLTLWWGSSQKTECPECRETWEGFPKINILLRDATDKLFSDIVQRRRTEIQANPKITESLLAFQRYGDSLKKSRIKDLNKERTCFLGGVVITLLFVLFLLLVYLWGNSVVEQYVLLIKPVTHWTSEDVVAWLEDLGPWAQMYREPFQQENVNGRLLLILGEEELLNSPYSIENQVHRRAILAELERVKDLGVKPPQSLWEYKAAHAGKSLFLLYALRWSPRLTIFYLYLFDYSETFLPFLHTCCPAIKGIHQAEENAIINTQVAPTWEQWTEFLVKYCLLPYQLIAEFAWDWLSAHYCTSLIIIIHAMLLAMLEGCTLWRLWKSTVIRTLPNKMRAHLCQMLYLVLLFILLWPLSPQFMCNFFFYWGFYCSPIINMKLLWRQLTL